MNWVVGILAAIAITAVGVLLWQRAEIKELEAEQVVLTLSNESLQKQAEKNLKFVEGATKDLQTCLDSKDKLVKSFENVNTLIRRATPSTMDKDKVVDNETLRHIIDNLNKPLPSVQ